MRILAIDDEQTTSRLYENLLTEMGHEVVLAQTGTEAFAETRKQQFDLIILDLKLPDMHGSEVLLKIKGTITDAPVIIVTANPTLDSSIDAIKSEVVYDYIVKPFSQKDLKKIVGRAVDKVLLTQSNRRLMSRLDIANKALSERVDQLEKFAKDASVYQGQVAELKRTIKDLKKKLNTIEKKK